VLAAGDQVPDATVWLAPRQPATIADLVEDRAALFVFFLFAWSKSQWGRELLGGSSETAPHRDEQRAPGGTRMFR
jgi:hypothetical protein